ncbi:hypothetical protein [Dyella mobilis]|uniref:Uncharacterized protein n=1 Tax=Dyella mobilis TaxID=1849582 RepID=A0ABS2KLA7_9GAMM|nr:hypothetical protein [Dyella mobilis]MBM7131704.1 hypothetical protein [Dyella mobilis]GLQ96320.1 hypothetical protein GCM10007863_07380 [Dyella mobilis]
MSFSRFAAGIVLTGLIGWPGVTFAAPPAGANAGKPGANPASSSGALVDGFGQAVSTSALQSYSGGSSLVQSNQNLTGNVSSDSASQVTTGNNAIAGGSFEGASGLPSVIQNTGNNVLIQNGVIVNVQMKP